MGINSKEAEMWTETMELKSVNEQFEGALRKTVAVLNCCLAYQYGDAAQYKALRDLEHELEDILKLTE